MILGPPSTGKSCVAAHIAASLYSSAGDRPQRTVLLAQSQSVLDNLLGLLVTMGIKAHHLMRLGGSSGDGAECYDFSQRGRLNWCLARRLYLLGLVSALASSLEVVGDVGASCELAGYFFMEHVKALQERCLVEKSPNSPFSAFVQSEAFQQFCAAEKLPSPSAPGACFAVIAGIFSELAEYIPLEKLRSKRQRHDFWLASKVRICPSLFPLPII